MPAIVLVMGKKEGCNKMSKKTHFVTAPFLLGVKQWNYLPSKVALRFSQKAAMPSFWSAVEKQRPKTSAS